MLTVEMLRQNAALSGLTDTQLTAITQMSQNDEANVIATKISSLHNQYDADILSISGIKRAENEKSYDYAKRVLNEYKAKIDATKDIQTKLDNANTKIAELNDKIAKGEGDAAIRQQLKDAKNQVTQLQQQLATKETELSNKKAEFDKSVKDIHVGYAFKEVFSGLQFKDAIPESIRPSLMESAKSKVLSRGTIDFIDGANGTKTLVMRDANGQILNNPNNNLNPYTIKELLMETELKDVVTTDVRQRGGGTIPPGAGGGGNASMLDLSGAKTQVEADTAITKYLLSTGITMDSPEFAEQSLQLRNENNIGQLPIR